MITIGEAVGRVNNILELLNRAHHETATGKIQYCPLSTSEFGIVKETINELRSILEKIVSLDIDIAELDIVGSNCGGTFITEHAIRRAQKRFRIDRDNAIRRISNVLLHGKRYKPKREVRQLLKHGPKACNYRKIGNMTIVVVRGEGVVTCFNNVQIREDRTS